MHTYYFTPNNMQRTVGVHSVNIKPATIHMLIYDHQPVQKRRIPILPFSSHYIAILPTIQIQM